ncbi:hypothetical protein [Fretibacter rubidus]|uniref:hypothetical protein n=1 Tax=Fretibacter rubidus TaxID=570162 RepID=UPI00352A0F6B
MINLDGRTFTPRSNSEGGRVQNGTLFIYEQSGIDFIANYSGHGVSHGHIIGKMTGPVTADIVYHSRSQDGALEAGQATVEFKNDDSQGLTMHMNWQWLNRSNAGGSKIGGTSLYKEIL